MASEKEIIITFLFNRSGKSKLSYNEIYLTLSMQLNWFTPDDAKLFINQTIEEKLIKKEKDLLSPNFDYKNIVVPVGFTPSKMVFKEKTEIPKKKEINYQDSYRFYQKDLSFFSFHQDPRRLLKKVFLPFRRNDLLRDVVSTENL